MMQKTIFPLESLDTGQKFKNKGMGVDKAEIKVASMPSMSLQYSNKIEKLQRCKTFQPILPNCLLNSCKAMEILKNIALQT